jgi:hypothetical protein
LQVYSSDAEALPTALTAQILQHVPLSQRLGQCSLVSQAWASAAVLATQHVVRSKLSADAIPSLEAWLKRHGTQLLSLRLSCGSYNAEYQLQLPLHKLAKLQWLQLEAFQLLLPGEEDASTEQGTGGSGYYIGNTLVVAGTSGGATPAAQRDLQHLQLKCCQLLSIDSLLQLAAAPQLTFLKLRKVHLLQPRFVGRWGDSDDTAKQQLADALAGLLQQLPRLSVLALPEMPVTTAAAQRTTAMQGLRCVELEILQGMLPSDLQHLPGSITQIQLRDSRPHHDDRSASLPAQLQQLTGLLHLELDHCYLPPTLLGSVTQLQHLRLTHCVLLPSEWHDQFHTEGTAALLDTLPQLKQLQDLTLHLSVLDTVGGIAPTALLSTDSLQPPHFAYPGPRGLCTLAHGRSAAHVPSWQADAVPAVPHHLQGWDL